MPNGSLPLDTIERLVSFRGRGPGTAAERQAADYLAGELEALGREAQVEPIHVRPAYHLTYALHAALAVVGSVVSVYVEPLGVVILLLVAVSMYLDLTARFYLLRLLMPRRSSQNVTSRGSRPEAPARLVLTAHYDAARSGLLFARWSRPPGPLRRLVGRLGGLAGPIDLVFWTIIVLLLFAVARLLIGEESTLFTAAQFVPTVLMLVAVVLFVDIALSEVVPGASDNASGVAATLELARRLRAAPPDEHLDVWVVFTGAKEGLMLGMREWMRAHASELDERRTFFVNIDTVGRGAVRYVTGEGFVVISQPDRRLVELCSSIGNGRPYIWRTGTDGTIPIIQGRSSITICCADEHGRIPDFHRPTDTPDRIEPEAIDRAITFAEKLVRRIDAELVPSIFPTLSRREQPRAQP
jgi:peptidase M28-like protein